MTDEQPYELVPIKEQKIRVPFRFSILLYPLLFTFGLISGVLLMILVFPHENSGIDRQAYQAALQAKNLGRQSDNTFGNAYMLPINPQALAVKSAGIRFLMVGRIHQVTTESRDALNVSTITMQGPTGEVLDKTFRIPDDGTVIVTQYNANAKTSTPYALTQLQRGDPIELNYVVDLKHNNSEQVTNIIKY